MSVCKHCGRSDLKWVNTGTEENKKFRLEEPDGTIHACMKSGEHTRLHGIFIMLNAMSPAELVSVIAYSAKELESRAHKALHDADPPSPRASVALKPGPSGPEPIDENLPF